MTDLPGSVVVVGTGLIGTSVALALCEQGVPVWLADRDPAAVALAVDIGAGQRLPAGGVPGGPADVAVLAVPPAAVAAELQAAQHRGLARAYTDVASVKELPLAAARALRCDLSSYVPGHPLSGRERSGPAAAKADLFAGRPWVLCPQKDNDDKAISLVTGLAEACRALVVAVPAPEHDQWVALVSHAPHVVAAAMAARLAGRAGQRARAGRAGPAGCHQDRGIGDADVGPDPGRERRAGQYSAPGCRRGPGGGRGRARQPRGGR